MKRIVTPDKLPVKRRLLNEPSVNQDDGNVVSKKTKQHAPALLGRLRTRPDITFCWIQPEWPARNDTMGRVYFCGFKLFDKDFYVNDIVEVQTKKIKLEIVRIVSVFQATKTFEGKNGDDTLLELQKRGHPYMEVQRYGKKKPETLPDWLLVGDLTIRAVDGSNKIIATMTAAKGNNKNVTAMPAVDWHASLKEVKQKHYYRDVSSRFNRYNLESIQRMDDSDSSDDGSISNSISSIMTLAHYETNVDLKEETSKIILRVPNCEPLPQLLLHQQFPLFGTPALRFDADSDAALNVLNSAGHTDLAEIFTSRSSTLSQKIEIVLVNENREIVDGHESVYCDNMSKKIKEAIAPFYGWNLDLRLSQYRAILELMQGRCARLESHNNILGAPLRYDVFYSAPCGFGKSLCFVAAAYLLGGITIIVEPLNALIKSQMSELKRRNVNVERLQPQKESSLEKPPAYAYLTRLVKTYNITKPPLIIFSTPELLSNYIYLIKDLDRKKCISLIVLDEFDCIDDCHDNYRKEYATIVPKLKNELKESQVPFLYLSATGSSYRTTNVLLANSKYHRNAQPILFQSLNILPSNHIYRVERKTTLKQSVERMASILKNYITQQHSEALPRSVCFCLTHNNCEKAVCVFESLGIPAAVFSSDTEKSLALAKFHDGSVLVLCATSAFGRGVHIEVPIRFIFHLIVPASLTDYVQATGRGGRDGKKCECILFFRPQDFARVRKVIKFEERKKEDQERCSVALDNVFKYAMEGKECRHLLLAQEAISYLRESGEQRYSNSAMKMSPKCSAETACDNCSSQVLTNGTFTKGTVEISGIVDKFLVAAASNENFTVFWKKCMEIMQCMTFENDTSKELFSCSKNNNHFSLLSDIHRFFIVNDQLPFQIRGGQVAVHLKHTVTETLPNETFPGTGRCWYDFESTNHINHAFDSINHTRSTSHDFESVQKSLNYDLESVKYTNHDFESVNHTNHDLRMVHCESAEYLLYYESKRLRLTIDNVFSNGKPKTLSNVCEFLLEKTSSTPPLYLNAIRKSKKISLAYRAELKKDGTTMDLKEPERADDKRIFRMYGSDRFLEVSIPMDVSEAKIKEFCSSTIKLANRSFKFFWYKREEGITAIFFAESGPYIAVVSIASARERCIPIIENSELTLGKWVKRMKLNFSTTTPACVLPTNSVTVLEDFQKKGVAEIDGAGLVSYDALNAILAECKQNGMAQLKSHATCDFSGFQGRLAGFKGVWILDTSLPGFLLHCRKSQLKYNVPLKCIDASSSFDDALHETIEVNSFCNKIETTLNIRVIQILEHYAKIANKEKALEELLMNCVQEAAAKIEGIANEHSALESTLKVKLDTDKDDSYDSQKLRRMVAARVDLQDPEFTRLRSRWLKNQFTRMKDKANYALNDCMHLRLYPDHTLLLLENEAFVAVDGREVTANEVVAMRSPSYFAGDLRKLKLVSMRTLENRANESKDVQQNSISFFKSVRHALITSIRGSAAEASRMSGGDYDGDRAWLSWNSALVDCLPDFDKFVAEKKRSAEPSDFENRKFSGCKENDIVAHMIHFRDHKEKLSIFSELLDYKIDYLGFDDEDTKRVGLAAFFQVDMPYVNTFGCGCSDQFRSIKKWPDWKGKSSMNSYKSERMLGKMYRKMTTVMDNLIKKSQLPPTISEYIAMKLEEARIKKFTMEEKATAAFIQEYVQKRYSEYEKRTSLLNYDYHYWKKDYFASKRTELLQNLLEDPEREKFAAAYLFKYCHDMERNDKSCHACEFAWGLFFKELIEIYAGDCPLIVNVRND